MTDKHMSNFDMARLGRLHDVMSGYVERGDVPGIVTAVSRRGEVHVDAIGSMALGGSAPMTADAVFRIASVSKPITAAAAMTLVEECVLRLDDPVDEWLPELAEPRVLRRVDGPVEDTVPANRPITVRDLLTFTPGHGMFWLDHPVPITDAIAAAGLAAGPPLPGNMHGADDFLRALGSLPLLFQPGERWLYNTGLDLLSAMIPRVTGRTLGELLDERLFGPLGMVDSGFVAADETRLPVAYRPDPPPPGLGPESALESDLESDRVFDPAAGSQWLSPHPFESGAGGLLSTAADLLAFGEMLLARGRHPGGRLLGRATVQAMTTDQLTPAVKAVSGLVPGFFDTYGWGLGMAVVTAQRSPDRSPGSFGWDGGFGTSLWVDPVEQFVGVQLTQRLWSSPVPPPVCRDFWTGVYQALDD